MFSFRAQDSDDKGAPYSVCHFDVAFRSLAPQSCAPVAGSVPPRFVFNRHDYYWLSLCLAAGDPRLPYDSSLDSVFVGNHTLSWLAMHDVVSRAVAMGFAVPRPTDVTRAVQSALRWSLAHRDSLRRLNADDFETLPPMNAGSTDCWWLRTSYASWVADGLLQPLCHMLGCSGTFWDAASRAPNSRLHLCFSLTQEFLPESTQVFARRVRRRLLCHHYAPSATPILSYDAVSSPKRAHRTMGVPPRRRGLSSCCSGFRHTDLPL